VVRVSERPAALETHGFGVNLLFDEHGLSPYWGVVSVYEPDHDERVEPFEAIGETWEIDRSNHWEGKIAPPEGQDHIDGGMNEYSYSLVAQDEIGDKDVNLQFRPGFPDAEHVDSGEPIQGMPDECPESIRVQVTSTNVDHDDLLDVLVAFAEHIGLNRDYFDQVPHEYSSAYQIERYGRLLRHVYEDHIAGAGGILDQLGDWGAEQRGRGKIRWDNEEIVGHYHSVAMDPDTWRAVLPGDDHHGKAVKGYHPQNPRSSTNGDDPLAHPKVEVSLSNDFDPDGSVPWSEVDAVLKELDETLYNVLHYAGVPLPPDAGVWCKIDPYFDVRPRDESIDLQPDPLPELRDHAVEHAETEMIRSELSPTQERVLTVLTDGGSMHYDALADEAEVGTSTVYRLVDNLSSLLETDSGIVRFADDVTRRHVQGIVDKVRETADWARSTIKQIAQEQDLLRADDGPLQRWMQRHGVRVVRERPELEFALDKPLSEREIQEIVRAGLEAAEASGMLTGRFESGLISWVDMDGNEHSGWKLVVDGYPLFSQSGTL
jgi:hypothetical protein